VSSEQEPQMLIHDNIDDAINSLNGDWNIQADATLSHFVDFSHWFCLPYSPLDDVWKMSTHAVKKALAAGAPHMSVFHVYSCCCSCCVVCLL